MKKETKHTKSTQDISKRVEKNPMLAGEKQRP